MKKIILLTIFIVGCASGKIEDSTLKVADNIKVADTVKVAENIKLADEIKTEAKVIAGVDNSTTQKTEQSAGRDLITKINNDSKMITELNNKVLDTYKELTNKYIWLLRYIIGALFLLIGKYELQIRKINERLLESNEQDDEFKEDLIKDKEAKV